MGRPYAVVGDANHPHEGSGGGRQEHGEPQRAKPTIPMRGQEIVCGIPGPPAADANHPHEGSGDGREAAGRLGLERANHPHEGSGGGRQRAGRYRGARQPSP